jgi:uncharacterized Zn finger protein (UPF0148 family)
MKVCPECGFHVMDTNEDGTLRLRAKVILFRATGTVAVCKSCGTEVPVPVAANPTTTHVVIERLSKRRSSRKPSEG